MISVNWELLLDQATVGEYEAVEEGKLTMRELRSFWARFLVVNGKPAEPHEALEALKALTLRQFQALRREGELREIAVPLQSGSS